MKILLSLLLVAILPFACFAQSSDLEKIDTVLSKMSARARSEIKISDKEAFLSDLKAVFDEEKNFTQDDLSPYFLIDKKHNVSADYVPRDMVLLENNTLFNVNKPNMTLRRDAYKSLQEMCKAALSDGVKLLVSSAYRSYSYQERLFNNYVRADGLEAAERYSARPGTSQHQLGMAIDFGSITDDFADTKMGRWVYNNAARFGWTLSFPKGYEDITGYQWECWHFRYVGNSAAKMQKKYFCDIQQYMLEFFDLWRKA